MRAASTQLESSSDGAVGGWGWLKATRKHFLVDWKKSDIILLLQSQYFFIKFGAHWLFQFECDVFSAALVNGYI